MRPPLGAAPVAEPSAVRAPAPARGARPRPAPSGTSVEMDPLREALRYLRRAQRFLREHEASAALAVLDDMDRQIAPALLAEERHMTRVLAQCERGDATSARALARRLLAEHPDSVYITRLQNTCVPDVAADALEWQRRRRTP